MQSFWQENVRHWQKTTGAWACAMAAIVVVANDKSPSSSAVVPAAHATMVAQSIRAKPQAVRQTPNVSLSYTPLDLSVLDSAAYGDAEI